MMDADFVAVPDGHLYYEIAGAEKVTLPGVDHLATMEAPTRFTELVCAFLGAP